MDITLPSTLVYSNNNFSETFTISTGLSSININSITVTKGTGSTLAYDNLFLTRVGSGNSQNFKTSSSLTFQIGTGISEVEFTLTGKYTDYLFNDQEIGYYYNPENITIGIGVTKTYPQLSVNTNSSNPNAYSFMNYQQSVSTATTTGNISQFYFTAPYWTEVPNPVDALYSFRPSEKGPQNYQYIFTVNYTGTYIETGSGSSTVTVTHPASYNIDYQKAQFLDRLNNQRLNVGEG